MWCWLTCIDFVCAVGWCMEIQSSSFKFVWVGWQKLCKSAKGLRLKVCTQTKNLSPNIRYFVAILRFVAMFALSWRPWAKKCFLGQKQCFLDKKCIINTWCVYCHLVYHLRKYWHKFEVVFSHVPPYCVVVVGGHWFLLDFPEERVNQCERGREVLQIAP